MPSTHSLTHPRTRPIPYPSPHFLNHSQSPSLGQSLVWLFTESLSRSPFPSFAIITPSHIRALCGLRTTSLIIHELAHSFYHSGILHSSAQLLVYALAQSRALVLCYLLVRSPFPSFTNTKLIHPHATCPPTHKLVQSSISAHLLTHSLSQIPLPHIHLT
jgi:hypothetical protein